MADPRVAVALVSSYPLHVGGAESHLLTLLRHADSSGYRFFLIAPASPEFTAQAEQLSAKIIQWRLRGLTDLSGIRALSEAFQHHQIQLAHFHCPRSAFIGRLPARRLGMASVVTTHLAPWQFQDGRFYASRLLRALYLRAERFLNHRFTNHLIFVSASLRAEAESLHLIPPAHSVTVIPNGVDLSRFDKPDQRPAIRRQLQVDENSLVLCSVGRFDHQKGFDVLLDALSRMKFQNTAAQCWLIGDGALRDDLKKQVARTGLQECVRFLGFRADVPDLLQASDLFVLPSRYEATPIALIEALAAGLPCIATDVGENARLLEHNISGIIVPPENPRALAAAIEQLLNDPAQRRALSEAARRMAASFSDVEMTQRTMRIYQEALHSSARQSSLH